MMYRRLLFSLLVLVLMVAAVLSAACGTVPGLGEEKASGELVILHFNDLHGYIENLPMMVGMANEYRSEHENLLILVAGDIFSGQAVSDLNQGEPVISLLNDLQVDALTMGNHDFDYGQEALAARMTQSDFPWLAANLTLEGEVPFEAPRPYIVKEVGGVRVAIIGLTQNPPATHPKNLESVDVYDSLQAALELGDLHEKESADLVIYLTHIGADNDYELARGLPAGYADIIIGGHSHTEIVEPMVVNGVSITQAGDHGSQLGVLNVTVEEGRVAAVTGKLVAVSGFSRPDEAAQARVKGYLNELQETLDRVIGTADNLLLQMGSRRRDVSIGNLITDAMLWATGADMALTNNGGIRAGLQKGQITMGDVYEILPFGNHVVTIEMKGEDLRRALKFSYAKYRSIDLQVAGGGYTIKTDDNGFYEGIDVTIAGAPINDDAVYRVATNDYIASGGSGYVFRGDVVQTSSRTMAQIVIDYISDLGTVNTAGEGRIEIAETVTSSDIAVGVSEVDLEAHTRYSQDSAIGNLICDAYRYALEADIALHNNGGIDIGLGKGPITMENLRRVLSHSNEIVVLKMKGADIETVLEHAWNRRLQVDLQVSGLTVKYTVSGLDQLESMEVTIDGEPLDPEGEYLVATNSYIYSGGGDYELVGEFLGDSWPEDDADVVARFIQEALDGVVTAVESGQRITVERK